MFIRVFHFYFETDYDYRHLVVVPPGPHLLSELLNSSPILAGDRGIPDEVLAESTGTAAAGAAGGFEFGVDPSLDPELAMVSAQLQPITHPPLLPFSFSFFSYKY